MRKICQSRQFGPRRTGQIFVYFAKKSVINSLRQVRPVIFRSTKFCQALPKLQRRRRPASEQDKFLSGVKFDRLVNLYATIWRKMPIKKIWSILEVGAFQSDPKPAKIISYLRGNQTVKMEDSFLGIIL